MTARVMEAVFLESPYTGSGRGLYTEGWFPAAFVRAPFKLLLALQLKSTNVAPALDDEYRFDAVSVVPFPQLLPIIGDYHHRADSFVARHLDDIPHLDASGCRVMADECSVNFTEAAIGDLAEGLAECEVQDGLFGGLEVDDSCWVYFLLWAVERLGIAPPYRVVSHL